MLVGPVFTREVVTAPRQTRMYTDRAVYVAVLLVLMWTSWLLIAGTQQIRNVGDMARFGSSLFQNFAWLQLLLVLFFSALLAASAVAQEKDRRTLILLVMTRLTNSELVLGKLLASLLNVLVMLTAALPVFMLSVLYGGVSFEQIGRVFLVTLATVLAAGSLGSTIALWREKTFATLAMTALVLVLWLGAGEVMQSGVLGPAPWGVAWESVAIAVSPIRAIMVAARPAVTVGPGPGMFTGPASYFLLTSMVLTVLVNVVAIAKVRSWNPSHEVQPGRQRQAEEEETIWSADRAAATLVSSDSTTTAEAARSAHVDDRGRVASAARATTRDVWDNPILWREVCTWAYGRKVIAIRIAYLLVFSLTAVALYVSIDTGAALHRAAVIPPAAMPLVPLFLVSLVIVNALAVTSITNERDGRALDLLLATDLSPKEFVFGKLGGVFWVTRAMIGLPMLLCVFMFIRGGIGLENLCYLLGGLVVMNVYVAMLGIHFGMSYANSRTAIGLSLGTVFFLFFGVVACILMMISFSGSFQIQLFPFFVLILGGWGGLFLSLGARNPSRAIAVASALVPSATLYAIISFLNQHSRASDDYLLVFLVTIAAYGFTTAALMIPALAEFDVAMGRTTVDE